MACQDSPLPKWLRKAVRAGVISEPHAYLMMWYSQQEMEWIPLPECLNPAAEAILLLETPAGPVQ